MPFTVAHTAAALPIAWASRWRLPFSALVIGTMVPDLAGYFPSVFDYAAMHSLRGILTHCVPVGVICYYAYQAFFKQPLFDLLPDPARCRLVRFIERPVSLSFSGVVMVVIAVLCGTFTHVGWDSFTHGGTWATANFEVLNETVTRIERRRIPWYEVLQFASSLLVVPLLAIAAWWFGQQPRCEYEVERARIPQLVVWMTVFLLVVSTGVYFQHYQVVYPDQRIMAVVTATLKDIGAVTLVTFLLYAITMNLIWWRDRIRPPYLGER